MSKFKQWWTFDPSAEASSADNPHAPLRDDQRREALPLLTLAFGWGFLVTGLIVGGSLGSGLPFDDILRVTLIGNIINFILGALVGYIGYKTACNSGLLYRYVYGNIGARASVLLGVSIIAYWVLSVVSRPSSTK